MTRPNISVSVGRSVPEWVGRTPDEGAPPRVRLRVFDRGHGVCHKCGRVIRAGDKWTLEHLIALINWCAAAEHPHGNIESNLGITYSWCLPVKNAEDVAEKSTVYRKRTKDLGIAKAKGRGLKPPPGSVYDWSKRRYVREGI